MMMTKTIRLSQAQASAFECRDWDDEPLTRAAWDGDSRLVFAAVDAEALCSEITDASNAEDSFAQESDGPCRTFANRAARSLAVVAGKVLMWGARW